MIAVTILALCAVPALGNPIKHEDSIPGHVKEAVLEAVDAKGDAASFLAWELVEFNNDLNAAIKKSLENFVLIGLPAFDFGKSGIHHLLEIGNYFVSGFPLLGSAIDLGTKALEIKLKVLNSLGAYFLNSAKVLTETNLDILNGVGRVHLEALGDASKHSTNIVKESISNDMDTLNKEYKNSAISTAVETVQEAVHKE